MDGWFALLGVLLGAAIGIVVSQLELRRRRAERIYSETIPKLRIANQRRAKFVDEVYRECGLLDAKTFELAATLKERYSDTLTSGETPEERKNAYTEALDALDERLRSQARQMVPRLW